MKKYTKPVAKFHALKFDSPLVNSDNSLNAVGGSGDSTEETLSKSASFSFGDDDE